MKKIKLLSVILAVCMLFGAIPVISVNAAEKIPTSITIDSIPSDMYLNTPQNFFDRTVITVNFSDKTSRTITVNSSNSYSFIDNDTTAENGYAFELFAISVDSTTMIEAAANIYVSDFANLNFIINDSSLMPVEKKYTYPDDYKCPDVFANNWYGYSTNKDGTLTLQSYLGDSGNAAALEIPETVHGKTVTAIADYAFCSYYTPASITIPKTVTSIGDHALGYAFSDGEEHSDTISSELLEKLSDAKDTDTFEITISLYGDDYPSQRTALMSKYFPSLTKYDFDDNEGYIYIKAATKAQILAMSDESDIEIYSTGYDPDRNISGSIDGDLYDYVQTMKSTDTIKIQITLYNDEKGTSFKTLASNIMKKYFNNSSNYSLDADNAMLTTTATAAQILSMQHDSSLYVEPAVPANLDSALYYKLLQMNSTDSLSVNVQYFGDDNIETFAKSFVNKYFPGCNYETDDVYNIYIKDVTKAQIMSVPDNYDIIFNDSYELKPLLIDNFAIYGIKGSEAQKYAVENGIAFYDISGDNVLGDVNLDGNVNVNDATQIQKHLGKKTTLSKSQLSLADFNKDTKIDITDSTAIQKYSAHIA